MGHVAIPYKMERVPLSSRMLFINCTSILQTGPIAGWRESKEGRLTVFFTPPDLFGDNPDEEHPSDDFSDAEKSALSEKVENCSGQRLLYQFSPSTRQRITILADKV